MGGLKHYIALPPRKRVVPDTMVSTLARSFPLFLYNKTNLRTVLAFDNSPSFLWSHWYQHYHQSAATAYVSGRPFLCMILMQSMPHLGDEMRIDFLHRFSFFSYFFGGGEGGGKRTNVSAKSTFKIRGMTTVSGKSSLDTVQGPVSQNSQNFREHFRVSQLPLYLKNGEDLNRQTSRTFCFLLP